MRKRSNEGRFILNSCYSRKNTLRLGPHLLTVPLTQMTPALTSVEGTRGAPSWARMALRVSGVAGSGCCCRRHWSLLRLSHPPSPPMIVTPRRPWTGHPWLLWSAEGASGDRSMPVLLCWALNHPPLHPALAPLLVAELSRTPLGQHKPPKLPPKGLPVGDVHQLCQCKAGVAAPPAGRRLPWEPTGNPGTHQEQHPRPSELRPGLCWRQAPLP